MINVNELELTNANNLDGYHSIDASTTQAGIQAVGGLFNAIASKPKDASEQELKSSCGRKPLLGKKKKQHYRDCVASYLKAKSDANIAAIAAANPTPILQQKDSNTSTYKSKPISKKFLGMPIGLGIFVSILTVAGIGFGVYKLVTKK